MNIGNSVNACSGWALSSNTAMAAAQQRSSVSVSSMAASLIESGMPFCTSIFLSNGLFSFMFLSAPFNGFRFVRSPLSMVRGIRLFVHALSVCAGWRFVFHNNFVEV